MANLIFSQESPREVAQLTATVAELADGIASWFAEYPGATFIEALDRVAAGDVSNPRHPDYMTRTDYQAIFAVAVVLLAQERGRP